MIMILNIVKRSGKSARIVKMNNPRKIGLSLFIIFMITLASTQPVKAAMITEWTLAPGSTIPYGITFDDQSPYRVWFVEFGSDKVGRLNTVTGEIFEVVLPPNTRPWGIAFEKARQEIWYTSPGRNKVGIITNYGSGTVMELNMPSALPGAGYAEGPRGITIQENVNGTNFPYVWVTHYGGNSILKIDPYDKKTVAYWNLGSGFNPQSIIFSKSTGVWFTDTSSNKRIGNLNPLTGHVKTWTLPKGGVPWDIVEDSKGFIWVTQDGSNRIARLNPYSGEIAEWDLPTGASQPYGVTIDSQDNLWFADHAQNQIVRFSPDSNTFTEYHRVTGGAPWGIAFASDSRIWFTDEAGNKIGRIDPSVALTTITVTTISTTSMTTVTTDPSTASTSFTAGSTTASIPSTTLTTAPTTISTIYGLTETVRLLQMSTTQTITAFSNTTITVLGISTSYIPTTIATVTSTSTAFLTQTATAVISTIGTAIQTSYAATTLTSTFTSIVTTGFAPMIPGYSNPAILIGLALGLFALFALKRRTPVR